MRKTSVIMFLVALIVGQVQAADLSKVTYFPISYVSYHDVKADKLEVGLGRKQVTNTLKSGFLGSTEENVSPLKVTGTTTLGAESILKLNGEDAQNTTVRVNSDLAPANIGYGQADAVGNMNFTRNLKIGGTGYLTNLNTPVAKVQTLTLFGKAFPRCEVDADSDGNNMYWVRLKLVDGKDDQSCSWYLSCGAVAEENQCTMN